MNDNKALTPENGLSSNKSLLKTVLFTVIFFSICNLLFASLNLSQVFNKVSGYNYIFPGRERLPWGEDPKASYNLSPNSLDAMFLSHTISGAEKASDEFRVLVLGDSSTWGFLLSTQDTLVANINQANLVTADGKRVQAYNLAYPTSSLTKDLLLLDYGMRYDPDMIVWLTTLEAFPPEKQIFTQFVKNNPQPVINLSNEYDLDINPDNDDFLFPTYWERTIIGQRRALADLFRLQFYGVMWAATGIDQDLPDEYTLRQSDFENDDSFFALQPTELSIEVLAFDVLAAGVELAGEIPVLIINEPIFVSSGENSEIRYNFLYPRWAYDSYRGLMAEYTSSNSWAYLDLWNIVPAVEFTNTAVHVTPYGVTLISSYVEQGILDLANGTFSNYNYEP